MATRVPVIDYPVGDRSVTRVVWSGLLNGDDGSPIKLPMWPDRTVQVSGTFGAGGSVAIQGNNLDTPDWRSINDTGGTAIAITAAGFKVCNEVPLQMRPLVTAGDGTTNLTVVVILRTPTAIKLGS